MTDSEHNGKVLLGDPKIAPTDDKLKQDALSLCSQYLQFWDPGEVEVTVILSRPGARTVVYGTSVHEGEKLRHMLRSVEEESQIQALLVTSHKHTR